MSNDIFVDINNVSKYYSGKLDPAVDNINIQVNRGEFFGILGPNGAGKTTLISVLCSLLPLTSGSICIAGYKLEEDLIKIKKLIGVVSQDIALYEKLTAHENLYYFGRLYNIPKNELTAKIDVLLERLGLTKYKKEKIINFSGGMKRRINLIAGVLHDPELLFLDEPSVGVDVQSRSVIREFLLNLNKEGTTVIYTSHMMEDAQILCSRLAIIDNGKLIIKGTPADLINEHDNCENLEDVFLQLTGRKLRD